jgi:glycosyltransferase involved in cell wall biosynthesis
MIQDLPAICIISPLFHKAFIPPLNNLHRIISGLSKDNRMIVYQSKNIQYYTGNEKNAIDVISYTYSSNFIFRLANYVYLNVKIIQKMREGKEKTNIYLFFGERGLVIPYFVGKLIGKKTLWLLPSNFQTMAYLENDSMANTLKVTIQKIPHTICYSLVDYPIVYSQNLIREWHLEKYGPKILIAHEHFLDFTTFTVTLPLNERPLLIGYIGRLSPEKGVLQLVQALPVILGDHQDFRVCIGGTGQLMESIETALKAEKISDRTDLPGWISHDDLPRYFNRFRLLILPSYTEGLPNIMLEAMACGTPVLATPVGAIPDVIQDGITGFIMEDNSPECIAKNVIRALNHANLPQIAENGRKFVEENYTFERTVGTWRDILSKIR